MTHSTQQIRQTEGGFTLVELAIVMIIIGLLIGGILKGQELINNARVSSTVSQTKAIETGISAFRDKYAAVPGDITNPTARIPACVGLCATAGNGDGLIATDAAGTAFDPGGAVVASEGGRAFAMLAAAGMIGGVGGGASAAVATAGVSNPNLPLPGSWKIGYNDDATMTGVPAAFTVSAGTYVVSTLALGTASTSDTTYNMTPVQAAIIDRKVDDGLPGSGSVIAIGGAPGAATCASAPVAGPPAVDSVYNEALGTVLCAIAVKVQ